MNDLLDINEALGQPEPPSPAAYTAARAALLRSAAAARPAAPGSAHHAATVRGQRRSHRVTARWRHQRKITWLAGGLGLTTAAATVAVVVATGLTGTAITTGRGHTDARTAGVSRLSARQILLAAATTAAAAPPRTGTYWYLKETGPGPAAQTTTQAWYTHDGTEYDLFPYHKAAFLSSWGGFPVGGSELTYQQIQHLPTEPAALTAWITRSYYHPSTAIKTPPPGAPRPIVHAPPHAPDPRWEIHTPVTLALSDLLAQVPAPPALRAAAFRALAAMPDVTKLGQANGCVILRVTFSARGNKRPSRKIPSGADQEMLFISTSTLALHAWSTYQGTTTILRAAWTNARPPSSP